MYESKDNLQNKTFSLEKHVWKAISHVVLKRNIRKYVCHKIPMLFMLHDNVCSLTMF